MLNFALSMLLFFLFTIVVIGTAVFFRFRSQISFAYLEFQRERSRLQQVSIGAVNVKSYAETEFFVIAIGTSNSLTAVGKNKTVYPRFDKELSKFYERPVVSAKAVHNVAPNRRGNRITNYRTATSTCNRLQKQSLPSYDGVAA